MADSGALRQRRSKMHKAGDHRLCRSSCTASGRVGRFSVVATPPDGPKGQERAAEGQESPEIPAGDKGKLRWLAGKLAVAYEADPANALLARELRMTLQALMPAGKGDSVDDELADFFGALQT